MAKRERLDIIKDILTIINERRKIRITPLIRKTNLSTKRFKEYFNELQEKGLIKKENLTDKKVIVLTEKGLRFLEKYQTIKNFIEEFEL